MKKLLLSILALAFIENVCFAQAFLLNTKLPRLAFSTVSTNATVNATINPVNGLTIVDTWKSLAISTVNVIATTNAWQGAFITVRTFNSGHDVVLTETGNLKLSAASITLSNIADVAGFLYDSVAQRWLLRFFSDNE